MDLKKFKLWEDEEYCLKAVEENGLALKYVKEQTLFIKLSKQ